MATLQRSLRSPTASTASRGKVLELSGPDGGAIPLGLEEIQNRIDELLKSAGLTLVRKDHPALPPAAASSSELKN